MTRYEHAFLTKCAEHGVPPQAACRLMKTAKSRLGHEIAGTTAPTQAPTTAPDSAPAAADTPADSANAVTALADLINTVPQEYIDRLPSLGTAVGGAVSIPSLVTALGGAGLGALIDRKRRLRGALIGALLGIPAGPAGLGAYTGYKARGVANKLKDMASQVSNQT